MSDTHANSIAFVRDTELPPAPPPVAETGVIRWMRENLFSSVLNAVLTVLSLLVIFMVLRGMIPWFWNSTWNANSLSECREMGSGACFAVIRERWPQFFFGFYPNTEYWRPVLTFFLLFPAIAPVLFNRVPKQALLFSMLYPFIGYWLIWGGSLGGPVGTLLGVVTAYLVYRVLVQYSTVLALLAGVAVLIVWMLFLNDFVIGQLSNLFGPGLEQVDSRMIGGFLLTMILGIVSISLALPIGILLALGRQSDLLIIKAICIGFIEFIRGVPLITLLFVANVLLSYFLPPDTTFDLVLRVIILITMFASAYLAEVIRGGLAALPRGQYEAADSLGLDYWQAIRLIILPQALKISIPGIVNVFIGVYKDTTLVSIISMYDPLGVVQPILSDADWNGILWELYGFVALFFFISCYSMSQYSRYLENKLRTDHR